MTSPSKAVESAAFISPAKRERWEADHKAVQEADWRDYLQKLIGDAMEATEGL